MLRKKAEYHKTSRKSIINMFLHPALMGMDIVIMDVNHKPVMLLLFKPYEPAYEFFETSRIVYAFSHDYTRTLLFSDNDRNSEVDCRKEEKEVIHYIEKLPSRLFCTTADFMEQELNKGNKIAYRGCNTPIYAGDQVTLLNYQDETPSSYPDLNKAECTVKYSFLSDKFYLIPNKPLRGMRVFRDGGHFCTIYGHHCLPIEQCRIAFHQ